MLAKTNNIHAQKASISIIVLSILLVAICFGMLIKVRITIFYIIFFCLLGLFNETTTWYGVINIPVVDLLAEAAQDQNPYISSERYYQTLPPETIPQERNPRVHQAVYNDIVDVKLVNGKEALVAIDQAHYALPGKPSSNWYWMQTKFITPLTAQALPVLPTACTRAGTVILKAPWTEPHSGLQFSVGTRFVRMSHYDTDNFFAVWFPSWAAPSEYTLFWDSPKFWLSFISREKAHPEEKVAQEKARQAMVSLMYEWIRAAQPRIIPYVWGGASLISVYPDYAPFLDEGPACYEDGCWSRFGQPTPLAGLDCSGLIFLAARVAGFPYPYRTTTMLARNLPVLKKNQSLEPGDLIWFPGHVMVVGNIQRNEVIESRGYSSGFGKLHILHLQQAFKGVFTYQQLVKKFYQKESLELLDAQGQIRKVIHRFKIFKITN
jgi:cell wall-associated NlpC family hydrolase